MNYYILHDYIIQDDYIIQVIINYYNNITKNLYKSIILHDINISRNIVA
jgi:hypothetical protein